MRNLFVRLDLSYLYAFLGEATLGLTFIFYIILARGLGPEQYGIFAAATALGGILSFFIQFGLPALLAREVAANPHKSPKFTITFLLLEGLNSLPIFLLLLPLAYVLGFKGNGIIVCYLIVLAEVCRSAKQTLRSVLRGLGQFRTESISVALERSFTVSLATLVLFLSEDLVWVIATLVFVRMLDIVGLIYYLSQKVNIWSPINFGILWQTLVKAYPFALTGVLFILYYQIDMVMLKVLAPTEEVGFYSAAYRLTEIFSSLPRVVFLVVLTKFARCHAVNPDRLPEEIYKSNRLLLAVVLPVIVVAGLCKTPLIEHIYGEAFLPSIKPLSILLPSLGIKMFGTWVGYFFEATGREKYMPPLLLTTVIINIASNAILIPYLGAVGAAMATLLSEIVLATVGLSLMARLGYKRFGQRLILISLISLVVAAIPSLMLNGLNPAMAIGLMVPSLTTIIVLMRPNYFLRGYLKSD